MAFFAISPAPGHAKASIPSKLDPLRTMQLDFIQSYIEEAATKERLEPALLRAMIRVESNFNHKATSRVGAKGLMQLMPFTAEELGHVRALDARHPRANIFAGAKYLRKMINRFKGDLELAIAAYNAGPNAVNKYGKIPPFRETQSYVSRVMAEWKKERNSL